MHNKCMGLCGNLVGLFDVLFEFMAAMVLSLRGKKIVTAQRCTTIRQRTVVLQQGLKVCIYIFSLIVMTLTLSILIVWCLKILNQFFFFSLFETFLLLLLSFPKMCECINRLSCHNLRIFFAARISNQMINAYYKPFNSLALHDRIR